MKLQAVIFDLFGTLVDDFGRWIGHMQPDLIAALGVPSEPFTEIWRRTSEMRTIGKFQTVEASIEYVCGLMRTRVTPEQMTKAVEIRLRNIRRGLDPRADVVETLGRLKIAGYKIALLSNCSIEIPILWPETELADLFDTAVFSSRECLKKPDPRIYQLACQRLGLEPEACLYIADGENHELAAAAQLGLRAILFRNSSQESRGELLREAVEWQGDSITRVTEVLQRIQTKNG
jgi:putative hydrolase of the HAD superfamily